MDAVAEREMAVVGAPEVEAGPVPLNWRGIPVGRVDHQERRSPPRSPDRRSGGPRGPTRTIAGVGPVVAAAAPPRPTPPARDSSRHALASAGMPEQGERTVAQRGSWWSRGPRSSSSTLAGDELRLAGAPSLARDRQERRDEIVGRRRPAVGDDALGSSRASPTTRARRPLVLVASVPGELPMKPARLVRPGLQLLVVPGRDAQEVADDGDRGADTRSPGSGPSPRPRPLGSATRRRSPRFAPACVSIARAVNARPSALRSRVCTGGSLNTTQRPTSRRSAWIASPAVDAWRARKGVIRSADRRGIREGCPDVRVPRQHPGAQDRAPVNRILFAETAESGVRIRPRRPAAAGRTGSTP